MKKFFGTVICFILMLMCCISAYAEGINNSLSLEERIFMHSKLVCEMYGITLNQEDEDNLRSEIHNAASEYAIENNCSMQSAYTVIWEEILTETPEEVFLKNTRSSSGTEYANTQLPVATTGNIFFTDNSMPYNHVGMYTASDAIIESMPDYGVHEVAITDSTAWQECVADSHDQSCIMYVSGATENDIAQAIEWARDYVGCEYDREFLNNKKNTDKENKKFNCSELVWKAYRYGAPNEFDLDSNGGLAVYPNNIYNCDDTVYIRSF